MSALNSNTHFGVYTVIFNKDKTHVLVIKKARGPYTGLLDLPGGTPLFDEQFEETLKREVLEETSLTITKAKQLGAFLALFNHNGQKLRHTGIIFSAQTVGTPKQDPDGEDSLGCFFLPISDVITNKTTPFVKEGVAKALSF